MYIWIGIDVDKELQDLKERVEKVYDEMNYDNVIINLPYHISIKISFEIYDNKKDEIVDSLTDYFKTLSPFSIETKAIENENTICWLRYKDDEIITKIKEDVNSLLFNKYNIPYHEYDLDFIFHTTLFMDNDKNKVNEFYEKIKNESCPKMVLVKGFLIGSSINGDPGTYSVIKEITLD